MMESSSVVVRSNCQMVGEWIESCARVAAGYRRGQKIGTE